MPDVRAFPYRMLSWNVVFGVGAIERLPGEMDRLGLANALVLTTPGQAAGGRELLATLGDRAVGHFDQAAMHVPAETVDQATHVARQLAADCTVSIGGGSTIGLGKALASRLGLRNVAIPTTYAGSEMTNIWGITEGSRKDTGRDDAVMPDLAIYDPELTLTLSPAVTASSGLNALAQAVANVPSNDADVAAMALEAVRLISRHLPIVVNNPAAVDARSELLWGACLAGGALGAGTTGLHHRLCHILGGTFGTPHAETHAVLLPHSVACNAAATGQAVRKIAEAMGVADAAIGIFELAEAIGAPRALKDLGIEPGDLERVVAIAMETPISDAAPVTEPALRKLLEDAFLGRRPQP